VVLDAPIDALWFVTSQHIKQTKQNKQPILRYRFLVHFLLESSTTLGSSSMLKNELILKPQIALELQ